MISPSSSSSISAKAETVKYKTMEIKVGAKKYIVQLPMKTLSLSTCFNQLILARRVTTIDVEKVEQILLQNQNVLVLVATQHLSSSYLFHVKGMSQFIFIFLLLKLKV